MHGISKSLQIFIANKSFISLCLGIVVFLPVSKFLKTLCFDPSLCSSQPYFFKYLISFVLFIDCEVQKVELWHW